MEKHTYLVFQEMLNSIEQIAQARLAKELVPSVILLASITKGLKAVFNLHKDSPWGCETCRKPWPCPTIRESTDAVLDTAAPIIMLAMEAGVVEEPTKEDYERFRGWYGKDPE